MILLIMELFINNSPIRKYLNYSNSHIKLKYKYSEIDSKANIEKISIKLSDFNNTYLSIFIIYHINNMIFCNSFFCILFLSYFISIIYTIFYQVDLTLIFMYRFKLNKYLFLKI